MHILLLRTPHIPSMYSLFNNFINACSVFLLRKSFTQFWFYNFVLFNLRLFCEKKHTYLRLFLSHSPFRTRGRVFFMTTIQPERIFFLATQFEYAARRIAYRLDSVDFLFFSLYLLLESVAD